MIWLALIACPLIPVGAILTYFVKSYFKLKRAMRQTVGAIKESKVLYEDEVAKEIFERKQNKETRKIVNSIKAEL